MIIPSLVTTEQVLNEFAPNGKCDGIQVFKSNGRVVGYLTDLKVKFCKLAKKSVKKQKERKPRVVRKEIISGLVQEMVDYLRSELYNTCDVFVNETMPNIDVAGQRFYLMIGTSIDSGLRLNIRHTEYIAKDYEDIVPIGFKPLTLESEHPRNIAFTGLSKEDVVTLVNHLSDKI